MLLWLPDNCSSSSRVRCRLSPWIQSPSYRSSDCRRSDCKFVIALWISIVSARVALVTALVTWVMEWRVLLDNVLMGALLALQVLMTITTVPVHSSPSMQRSGRVLRITTVLLEPYMMARYKRGPHNTTLGVEYVGYVADLLHELSKVVGFQYELYVTPDRQYGFRQPDGTWNGMIKELLVKKADIAAGALLVTSQRSEVVNFTVPFINVHATLLMRKPAEDASTEHAPIRHVTDLINQSDISFGTLDKGIIPREFKRTNDSRLREVWKAMNHFKDSVFTTSNEQGIGRVRNENYAFVIQDTIGDYIAMQQPCDLVTVDKFLFSHHYALALRRDSAWLSPLNRGLQILKSDHTFSRLYRKWWMENSPCGGQHQDPSRSISLAATSCGSRGAISMLLFTAAILVFHHIFVEYERLSVSSGRFSATSASS